MVPININPNVHENNQNIIHPHRMIKDKQKMSVLIHNCVCPAHTIRFVISIDLIPNTNQSFMQHRKKALFREMKNKNIFIKRLQTRTIQKAKNYFSLSNKIQQVTRFFDSEETNAVRSSCNKRITTQVHTHIHTRMHI